MEFEELEKERQEGLKAAQQTAQAPEDAMTLRERFLRTMHYQHVDKAPNFEFGYWTETLNRWHADGLPEHVVDERTAYDYFGIERYYSAPINPQVRGVCEPRTIEETEDKIIQSDHFGVISEINKDGDRSIPHFIEFPIRDRETWQPFKEVYEDASGRYPENWDELAASYNKRDYPLGIPFGSLVGIPRNLIGFENLAIMVCEQPDLMEEIAETICQCVCRTIERALQDVRFDFASGWEDICFNSGPICGVPYFRDVLVSRYKRITDLLALHGVDIVYTDCDGNLTHVMPYFLEGGVNTMFPVEVHGGTDPVALRKEYGKELRFWGGVDKMIFLKDKKAVDDELQRLLPVFEEGGFIPTVDHRVQSDAKYDLYLHYLDRKREWFGVGGEPKY